MGAGNSKKLNELEERVQALKTENKQFEERSKREIAELKESLTESNKRERAEMRRQHEQRMNQLRENQKNTIQELKDEMKNKAERYQREAKEQEQKNKIEMINTHIENCRRLQEELIQTKEALTEQLASARQQFVELDELFHRKEIQHARECENRGKFERVVLEGVCKKIVMLGNTGDGKSTLGNRLTGDTSKRGDEGPFEAKRQAGSVTQSIEYTLIEKTGTQFCIFDTPGRGDSEGNDRVHATTLVDYLRGLESIHQFVLVRNVSRCRLDGQDQSILREFTDILGVEFWKNVAVVFTYVDDEDTLEDNQESFDQFLSAIRECVDLDEQSAPLRYFCVGKRMYEDCCSELLGVVSDLPPFTCDAFVAPVERLEEEIGQLRPEWMKLQLKVEEISGNVGRAEGKLESLEIQLNDWNEKAREVKQ